MRSAHDIGQDMVDEAQPIFCFMFGLVAIATGLVALPGAIEFARVAQPAEGIVVETHTHKRVSIEFRTPDGHDRVVEDRPSDAVVGDRVTVYYHPDEPWSQRTVGGPNGRLFASVGSVLGGRAVLGLGFVLGWKNRRRARER